MNGHVSAFELQSPAQLIKNCKGTCRRASITSAELALFGVFKEHAGKKTVLKQKCGPLKSKLEELKALGELHALVSNRVERFSKNLAV